MSDREYFGHRLRRATGPFKRWIGRTSARLFVALGILVFIILMLPGTIAVLFGNLWSCARGRMSCSALDIWVEIGGIAAFGVLYLIVFSALKGLVGTVVWSRMRIGTGRQSRCRALIMGLSDLRAVDREVLDHIHKSF